ncbi:hypothetical protein C8R43DRAFT_1163852 [Mycena crocata]|nr:hypothetical protein C8R43DRAFT_1163852 [Mycena crocata]
MYECMYFAHDIIFFPFYLDLKLCDDQSNPLLPKRSPPPRSVLIRTFPGLFSDSHLPPAHSRRRIALIHDFRSRYHPPQVSGYTHPKAFASRSRRPQPHRNVDAFRPHPQCIRTRTPFVPNPVASRTNDVPNRDVTHSRPVPCRSSTSTSSPTTASSRATHRARRPPLSRPRPS